jgi:hypothetical protein
MTLAFLLGVLALLADMLGRRISSADEQPRRHGVTKARLVIEINSANRPSRISLRVG